MNNFFFKINWIFIIKILLKKKKKKKKKKKRTFLSYSRKSVNTDVLSKLKNLKSLLVYIFNY